MRKIKDLATKKGFYSSLLALLFFKLVSCSELERNHSVQSGISISLDFNEY